MKKVILLSVMLASVPIYTMGDDFFITHIPETPAENTQQTSVPPFMRTVDDIYANNDTKPGMSSITRLDHKSEKTFFGMRAPVSDQLMDRYIKWQKEGELPLMNEELKKLDGKINDRYRLTFKRFKLERRKSFLNKVINNEFTQNLSIVRHGTLEEAEKLVYQLEHPPSAQFADSYMQMKREECFLARQILQNRVDYRSKVEQSKHKESSVRPEPLFKPVFQYGVQHEIIGILHKSQSHTEVTQYLDGAVNSVLSQAQQHNYAVHPELDWRLQAALKALPHSVDVKDFTFHLATVEHSLNDIQEQTARAAGQGPTLIERSPELLAQTVTKYFEYLEPTEGEISLIVDCARYVSDVALGTDYLSQEVREQRIAQFWQKIDNLSFENLSQISAEQVMDTVAYVAARATYYYGASKTIGVIKNLKNVGVTAIRGVAQGAAAFAQRFISMFDSVISANPVIITNEGSVVWNASQEAVAEARQIINAFDGMKDNPSDKKPPDILNDSQEVAQKESEIESAQKISIGTDKAHTFSESDIEKAVKHVINDKSRVIHIFEKELHNLDKLVEKVGGQENVIREVLSKIDGKIPFNGVIKDIVVNIGGYEVHVRGRVMEGVLKIGTLFIK